MAFDPKGLGSVFRTDVAKVLSYGTTDTLAAVQAAGYFDRVPGLRVGDSILVNAVDGSASVKVSRSVTGVTTGVAGTIGGGVLPTPITFTFSTQPAAGTEGTSMPVGVTASATIASVSFVVIGPGGADTTITAAGTLSGGVWSATLARPLAAAGYTVEARGPGATPKRSNSFTTSAVAAIPWRLPIASATDTAATGSGPTANIASAIVASATSSTPMSPAAVLTAPGSGTATRTIEIVGGAAIGTAKPSLPAYHSGNPSGLAFSYSNDGGSTWTALTRPDFAPSGGNTYDRNQTIPTPGHATNPTRLRIVMTATAGGGDVDIDFRWYDLNCNTPGGPRILLLPCGDSVPLFNYGLNAATDQIETFWPGADFLQLSAYKSATPTPNMLSTQVQPALAQYPWATCILIPGINYSVVTGGFTDAQAQSQQDWSDIGGIMDAVMSGWPTAALAMIATRNNNNGTTDNRLSSVNADQDRVVRTIRIPQIMARPRFRATSFNEATGIDTGEGYLAMADGFPNGYGGDFNHPSATGIDTTRIATRSPLFRLLTAGGFAVPGSEPLGLTAYRLAQREAGGTVAFAVRDDLRVLMDMRDRTTPTATTAQANARTAERNRLAAIAPPAGTTAPTITGVTLSGTAQVGQVLTITATMGGTPTPTATYEFWRGAVDTGTLLQSGAGNTYSPVAGDQSSVITPRAIGTNTNSRTAVAGSPSAAVAAGATGVPANGTATLAGANYPAGQPVRGMAGQALVATPSGWTNNPTSYAFQMNRGGTPISGASASGVQSYAYTMVPADDGATLSVTVTATNGQGNSTPVTSTATSAVRAAVTPASGSISNPGGTVALNQPFNVTGSATAGSDGFYSYFTNGAVRDLTPFFNHPGTSVAATITPTVAGSVCKTCIVAPDSNTRVYTQPATFAVA